MTDTPLDLPDWLRTELSVKRLFEIYGFDVQSISISGRQIDLVATRQQTFLFSPERWIVEITAERVGADKGGKDSQKLLLAQKEFPESKLMLISTAGFTDDQAATLKKLSILPLTYSEFESGQLNLKRYALNALGALKARASSDIGYSSKTFIEPELGIRREDRNETAYVASAWVSDLFEATRPAVCALLGDLGSGKTSILERALEHGCERFLEDPDTRPVPVFIPLGRYKQHSGDVEQMLMTELKRGGLETYPSHLIRHLISKRRIILLLDGLDEIHPIQNSEDILETITAILTSIGKEAAAVVTCRRQFFESSQEELAYFGSYTAGHLANVQGGLARILRNHPSTYLASVRPFDAHRIDSYLRKRCGMDDGEIRAFFDRFHGFREMASTPVLLAMMATAIEEKAFEPSAHDQFPLLSLYEAYTNRWIERDQGRARLSTQQRQSLSKSLADQMLWSAHESETWPQVREHLHQDPSWENKPLADDEAELDIRNSGFLVRDLDDRYRFIHRSIMEYFAAGTELERLASGARPRHFPTDGFRLFLAALMARKWAAGDVIFPPASWDRTRGDEAIHLQASMLAGASASLPSGSKVELTVRQLQTSAALRWTGTHFIRMVWNHSEGVLTLSGCELTDVTLTIDHTADIAMANCRFNGSTLRLPAAEAAPYPVAAVTAAESRLMLNGRIWDLSTWHENGLAIEIQGNAWALKRGSISLLADAYARCQESNRTVQTFTREPNGERFDRLWTRLRKEGWVDEWKRGKERSVMWTGNGNVMLGRLRNDPMQVQHVFQDIFG